MRLRSRRLWLQAKRDKYAPQDLGSGPQFRHEGTIRAYSYILTAACARRYQIGKVPAGLLGRTGTNTRGHARAIGLVGWRPGADGSVRREEQRVRVVHQGARS